jgi:hypothetical protein
LGRIFGAPIIATAILDRLLHHSTTINIRGESYRLKDRRQAELISSREQEGRTAAELSVAPVSAGAQSALPEGGAGLRSVRSYGKQAVRRIRVGSFRPAKWGNFTALTGERMASSAKPTGRNALRPSVPLVHSGREPSRQQRLQGRSPLRYYMIQSGKSSPVAVGLSPSAAFTYSANPACLHVYE